VEKEKEKEEVWVGIQEMLGFVGLLQVYLYMRP
jgi:hypothetical protein